MVPHRTPIFFKYLWPGLIWNVPNQENRIYLTFDDGPIPDLTAWVLETLAEFQIKATFFCVGDNVKKHAEIFQRLVKAGHAIGNHTFHHVNGHKTESSVYLEEVTSCDEAFAENNLSTDLFRPPYGRLKRGQMTRLKDKRVIMWDVLTKDYDQSLSPEDILRASIKATRSGSIIVFHDNEKATKNLKSVLPKYIKHMLAEGYQFDTL